MQPTKISPSKFIDTMWIDKNTFDELALALMELQGITYSTDAKLMIGGKRTPYPIHYETLNLNGREVKRYNILYASIDGKVNPVLPDIVTALSDESRAMAVPKGHTASILYHLGIPHHCDKPLEAVATELHRKDGICALWRIYMLRHSGEGGGYLNDKIAEQLL